MAGASGSGEEVETGRVNRAEGRTIFWAQVPPGQPNFNGPAILIAETAESAEDPDDYEGGDSFTAANAYHGLIAKGWSGGSASSFGGSTGAVGVIGRGGRNQGTGVLGLGGGTPEPGNGGAGGIGLHGLGGPQDDFFTDPTVPPGVGVAGQGGQQSANNNRERLPHAAGVIGISGGAARKVDLLPAHPLSATGGVGVYGQGGEAAIAMVVPVDADGNSIPGPNVASGPPAPGPGVLGRGGVPNPRVGALGAGVIGLAGDTGIPSPGETGNTGVYGKGPVGVHGQGTDSRGGVFSSEVAPQALLIPLPIKSPLELRVDSQMGDLLVTMDTDERGTRIASLWFCKVGGTPAQSNWMKLA